MDLLLIKLFVTHILGDFFFQPDNWVIEKESRKLKSPKLYFHILIHGLLTLLILWDVDLWRQILLLMFSHGLIDAAKLIFQTPKNKRTWFFADQLLHVFVLLSIWYFTNHPILDFTIFQSLRLWELFLAILFLTFPTSIIIKTLIAKWTPTSIPVGNTENNSVSSLQSAGKYIGIMERLLVLTFACANHWEAIGFLIAAKSIFRFGDLKDGNDLKLTEYILIGTFLSFGSAILVALLFQNIS